MVTKVWRNVSGDGISINVGCNLWAQKCLVDRFVNAIFSSIEWCFVFIHTKTLLNTKLEHLMKKALNEILRKFLRTGQLAFSFLSRPWAGMLLWPRPMVLPEIVESYLVMPGCKSHPWFLLSLKGIWSSPVVYLFFLRQRKCRSKATDEAIITTL